MQEKERENLINFLIPKVKEVLNYAHSNSLKREISVYHDRINFACPYCGDSKSDPRKKRGNIYLNTLKYVCFNEGCGHSAKSMLKDYDVYQNREDKEFINSIIKNIQFNNQKTINKNNDYSTDLFIPAKNLVKHLKDTNGDNIFSLQEISPIKENSEAHKYLKGRGINNFYSLMEGKLNATYYFEPVVIIFNNYKSDFISFQVRNLKGGDERYFKTYKYEKILDYVPNKINEETLVEHYNKVSGFFNLFNVDLMSPVVALEGYFDSTFINNAISISGIQQDTSILKNIGIQLYYLFDKDETGKKKMIDLIKRKEYVFLWEKFLKDKGIKHKSKLDINDLVLKYKVDMSNIMDYFSSNALDMIHI